MSVSVPRVDVAEGTVLGAGQYAIGNNGDYFAVSRTCRHLRADLADGSVDADGCLVCPWHHSKYDVTTGQMVRGPQGFFAKFPGLSGTFLALAKALPLRRGRITTRGTDLVID
jgi:nitrite reductase/ring-hydroxylating ferredoxin subunit